MIPSKNRFHGENSLRAVYQHGQTMRGQLLTLKFAPSNHRTGFRLAVVVSKKVDKSAVVRNRTRRRIYEIVRHQADNINKAHDMIITVFEAQVADMPAPELKKSVLQLLANAHITSSSSVKVTRGKVKTKLLNRATDVHNTDN